MDDAIEFIEVVAPQDFVSADREFNLWLSERGLRRGDIRDDDVRIDIVRQAGGNSAKRYRVRRTLIEKR